MAMTDVMAKRSRCVRRQAGCVLVSADNHVVATGYNGPPRGLQVTGDCSRWCPRAQTGGSLSYDDDLAVHAETNALLHADASQLHVGTAYANTCPCFSCAKNLANSGILVVVCRITPADVDRQPERSLQLLRDSGIGVMVQRDDGAVINWRG